MQIRPGTGEAVSLTWGEAHSVPFWLERRLTAAVALSLLIHGLVLVESMGLSDVAFPISPLRVSLAPPASRGLVQELPVAPTSPLQPSSPDVARPAAAEPSLQPATLRPFSSAPLAPSSPASTGSVPALAHAPADFSVTAQSPPLSMEGAPPVVVQAMGGGGPAQGAPGTPAGADMTMDAAVSPETLRAYMIALGVSASRFRRYPALARERGWEGRVEVVVLLLPGMARPQVSLKQGSGYELLDEQALRMVRGAVDAVPMPEGLRNRTVSLRLPVEFSLAAEK